MHSRTDLEPNNPHDLEHNHGNAGGCPTSLPRIRREEKGKKREEEEVIRTNKTEQNRTGPTHEETFEPESIPNRTKPNQTEPNGAEPAQSGVGIKEQGWGEGWTYCGTYQRNVHSSH